MGCSPWDLPALSAFRHSNLQCFLHSTTPFLPLPPHPHPQEFPTSDGCWEGVEKKEASTGRLFWLRDVWRCYEEWSAYGAAVPILLPSLDTTVQYYSPSLSALQIYTTTPFPFPVPSLRLRMGSKIDGCEIEENGSSDLAVWVESSQLPPRQPHVCGRGYLYCQYNEISSPYDRVPITQKINELAKDFPGLMELPSSHLSPYSWMAVAWYPLYQIPVVTNEQELSACFLTYHLFAFSSQGTLAAANPAEKRAETLGLPHSVLLLTSYVGGFGSIHRCQIKRPSFPIKRQQSPGWSRFNSSTMTSTSCFASLNSLATPLLCIDGAQSSFIHE